MSQVAEEAPPVEDRGAAADEINREVDRIGADRVLAEVRRNCFLMYVTVRAWRGNYLLRNAEVKIDGRTVDPKMVTKGQWKLIPEEWHKAIQPFESKTRAAVYKVGVAFKDGVYVVPKAKARTLVDEIKTIRTAYQRKVAEFQARWPDIVSGLEAKITHELGADQWMAVSKLIPDARKFPKLYDIEVGLWPVGTGGLPVECYEDLERAAGLLTEIDQLVAALRDRLEQNSRQSRCLAEFAGHVRAVWDRASRASGRMIEENAEAWMADAQGATNRMVAAAVEAMISEPVREFTEAVDNMSRLAASGTVRAGTLDAIRRAYQRLQGFSFLMPADLMARLREVEVRVGGLAPQDVNSGSVAGTRVGEALRAIRDEMNADASTLEAFGQFTRHLDL